MSEIIRYDSTTIRDYSEVLLKAYKERQTVALPFREWQKTAYPIMVKEAKRFGVVEPKQGELIRIAPTTSEMLAVCEEHKKDFEDIELNCPQSKKDYMITQLAQSIIKPKYEFKYEGFWFEADGLHLPMWFNTTTKGINLRYGFLNGDSSTPARLSLDDDLVHTMLGGATGQGKSVALHTIILNLLLEYPPWELEMFLADFKITELCKYANRIKTPHCKMIAASGSTEFVMSFYSEIVAEMNRRQILFNKLGVEKLSNLRKKLNMCIPRDILIVDEFVQQKVNIKKSEAQGNDNAADELKDMQNMIGELARLGRSMGTHMLFSSQSLEGALDSQTEGQFTSGAALKCQKAVSTSLIGNDAAAYIKGKGKIFVNPNKPAKEAKDNQFVRVPYMNTDQSPEEAARGDLTEQLKILQECQRNAQSVGYEYNPYYYNENDVVPYVLFEQAKKYAKEYFDSPPLPEVEAKIFKDDAAFTLPLGKPVKYNTTPSYLLTLKRAKQNNIVMSATNREDLNYMIQILQEGFMLYNHWPMIVCCDKATYLGSALSKYPEIVPKTKVFTRKVFPDLVMAKYKSRTLLLDLQELIWDATGKVWDSKILAKNIIDTMDNRRAPTGLTPEVLAEVGELAVQLKDTKYIPDLLMSDGKSRVAKGTESEACQMVIQFASQYNIFKATSKNFTQKIEAKNFEPIVVWFLGLDEMDAICIDGKRDFKMFLDKCCQCNIFCILMANIWSRAGEFGPSCDFTLERCSKEFFMDVMLPKTINTNGNSFQVIVRSTKERTIMSKYTT